jgi:hypothetical protein
MFPGVGATVHNDEPEDDDMPSWDSRKWQMYDPEMGHWFDAKSAQPRLH